MSKLLTRLLCKAVIITLTHPFSRLYSTHDSTRTTVRVFFKRVLVRGVGGSLSNLAVRNFLLAGIALQDDVRSCLSQSGLFL